jgi:hypothetical protein
MFSIENSLVELVEELDADGQGVQAQMFTTSLKMYEETLEICKQVTTIVSEQQTDEYEEFIKKLKFLLDLGRSRLKQKVNVDGCNTIGGIYFA